MYAGTNAVQLGDYNQQVVLELIRTTPDVSRVEIAKRTGLTAQAISKIVRKLVQEGLVHEAGTSGSSAKGGRPATGLRINPDAGYALGVHIDRDQTVYALLDLTGKVVARDRRPTPKSGPDRCVRQVGTVVSRLLEKQGISVDRVLGIGVGAPGPLDPEKGVVHSPGGMDAWGDDVPLKEMISERTGLQVTIENDAVAAAIGEGWIGRARGVRNLLFVYMGWGLGAALLIDGHVHRGSGYEGEFQHVPVQPSGPACECGHRGCVGLYVPATAVTATVKERTGLDKSYAEICQAAVAGESAEREVLTTAAQMFSLGLIGVTNVLVPDLVVLGGATLEDARLIYEPEIGAAFAKRMVYQRGHRIRVEISDAGTDVGAVGAASLVLHGTYAPKISPIRA